MPLQLVARVLAYRSRAVCFVVPEITGHSFNHVKKGDNHDNPTTKVCSELLQLNRLIVKPPLILN